MTRKNEKPNTENIICKHCGSIDIRRAGIVNNGNQRYKCKKCKRTFTITNRKYSNEFKLEVLKRYLDNHGVRKIEQRMNVSSRMIVYWVQQFGKILKETLNSIEIPKNLKDVQIIEIDRKQNAVLAEMIAQTSPKLSELMVENRKKLPEKEIKTLIKPNIKKNNKNDDNDSKTTIPPEYALLLSHNKIVLLIFR